MWEVANYAFPLDCPVAITEFKGIHGRDISVASDSSSLLIFTIFSEVFHSPSLLIFMVFMEGLHQ